MLCAEVVTFLCSGKLSTCEIKPFMYVFTCLGMHVCAYIYICRTYQAMVICSLRLGHALVSRWCCCCLHMCAADVCCLHMYAADAQWNASAFCLSVCVWNTSVVECTHAHAWSCSHFFQLLVCSTLTWFFSYQTQVCVTIRWNIKVCWMCVRTLVFVHGFILGVYVCMCAYMYATPRFVNFAFLLQKSNMYTHMYIHKWTHT
jgi:hypothetical protein